MKIQIIPEETASTCRIERIAKRLAERERCEVSFVLRDKHYLATPRLGTGW